MIWAYCGCAFAGSVSPVNRSGTDVSAPGSGGAPGLPSADGPSASLLANAMNAACQEPGASRFMRSRTTSR